MSYFNYEADWQARLRRRLFAVFRGKATWEALAYVIARQAQDVEDAIQAVATISDVDASVGAQLDVLGRHVRQLRGGLEDAVYRFLIRARAAANRSNGTPEELYGVFAAFFGGTASMKYTLGGPKQFSLQLFDPMDAELIPFAVDLLDDAKEAGARGLLEYQTVADAALFAFEGQVGVGFDVGEWADARQA